MYFRVVVLVVVSVVRRLVKGCVEKVVRLGGTSHSKNTSHFTVATCSLVGGHHCRY